MLFILVQNNRLRGSLCWALEQASRASIGLDFKANLLVSSKNALKLRFLVDKPSKNQYNSLMSNARKRPIDKPESIEVALIEDPSLFKCKVIRYSAGEWSKEIHIKCLRKSSYSNHWSGAHKLMSPTEADIWLNVLDEIIDKKEWEGHSGGVKFWIRPSISLNDDPTNTDLTKPKEFLTDLRNVVQSLRDELTS